MKLTWLPEQSQWMVIASAEEMLAMNALFMAGAASTSCGPFMVDKETLIGTVEEAHQIRHECDPWTVSNMVTEQANVVPELWERFRADHG